MRFNIKNFDSFFWRMITIIGDVIILFGSLIFALWFRFDNQPLAWTYDDYIRDQSFLIAISFIIYICLLIIFRMYKYAWRYAGFEAALSLYWASVFGTLSMYAIIEQWGAHPFPRPVILMFWLMSSVGIGSSRIILRVFTQYAQEHWQYSDNANLDTHTRLRAIMVGSVEKSATILKTMALSPDLKYYEIVGFLDDKEDRVGMYYGGVRVLGTSKLLPKYIEERSIDQVLFVISDESEGAKIRDLVLECRKQKIQVKVIPNLQEILNKPAAVRVEDIHIEDLLRRPAQNMDLKLYSEYICGKRVLVTGAGGSIGSEICRQVMRLNPAEIILLGHGENSIFGIQQDLNRFYPEMSNHIIAVIASITNAKRIDRIFNRFKPEVVFHAAAHKHLPLMEENVCEAVLNNVMGTRNVVEACVKHKIKRMVQISTDKAADPSSVMGATKWACEEVVKSNALIHKETSFIIVRFGNVLGSRGSVIPVFTDQIKNGGPVTVTSPEMTRYFMTIPEAVRLVIQAGSVGKSGDLYLLDMGQPVKIVDLAEDMIRINGYEPHTDIEIVYTGVRPGEKMHEKLVSDTEKVESSGYEGMNKVISRIDMSYEKTTSFIEHLEELATKLDGKGVLDLLEKEIPGYSNEFRCSMGRMIY